MSSGRSDGIDTLRGVALLVVIAGHSLLVVFGGGDWLRLIDPVYGVSLFFVISGALVAPSIRSAYRTASLRGYLIRRGARLLLPHAFAVGVYAIPLIVAIRPDDYPASMLRSPEELLASLSLLFAIVPHGGAEPVNIGVPGNWSISTEWLAALVLLPLFVRIANSERRSFYLFLALSLVGGILSSLLVAESGSASPLFWAPLHAGAFAGGWWAALRAEQEETLDLHRRLAAYFVLLLLVIAMFIWPSTSPALAGVIGSLLVYRALRQHTNGGHGRLAAALSWIGSRSYGGYLAHFIGYLLAIEIGQRVGLTAWPLAALTFFGGCVAAFAAAEPFARLIERPAIKLGKPIASHLAPRS